jgi:autotransporter translocation and assembly factor TamB
LNESPVLVGGDLQDKKISFRLTSSRLNLKGLSLPWMPPGNLGGTAEVEIKGTKEGQVSSMEASLYSPDFEWDGRKLPGVSASVSGKGDLYDVLSLEVTAGESPLRMAGKADTKAQTISLQAGLKEYSIPSILTIMGGATGSLHGALSGPLKMEGPLRNPEFNFNGKVHNLIYQNRKLGNGKLKISGNAGSLKGRLDLDKSQNPLQKIQFLPISGILVPILGPLTVPAKIFISATDIYFEISGTPKNPVVTPKPKISGLGALGPDAIKSVWGLFQMVLK